MQIVYISNRSWVLRETIPFIEAFLPYIEEIVVVCPGAQMGEFKHLSQKRVVLIEEDELLNRTLNRTSESIDDHQTRNWALRSSLSLCSEVHDEFIMSDDDFRPLFPISKKVFREDSRHCPYYFFDLKEWPNFLSEYDRGQHETGRVLEEAGLSTHAFSSHMPQMVDKSLLERAVDRFAESRLKPLDEWSLYFNFAIHEEPARFASPQRYRTVCWTYPLPTRALSRPESPIFENFYKRLYEKDGIFEGLPQSFQGNDQVRISREKLRRCMRWQRRADVKRLLTALSLFWSRLMGWVRRDVRVPLPTRSLVLEELPTFIVGKTGSRVPIYLRFREQKGSPEPPDNGSLELPRPSLGHRKKRSSGEFAVGLVFPETAETFEVFGLDFLLNIPARPGIYSVDLGFRGKGDWESLGLTLQIVAL